ncbi:MAG: dockerin type I domain-containing protein [Oscillospiraceae bacterium]
MNEIDTEYKGTVQSYYFSDSKGTVAEDKIENISVTGVDCGIDVFKNYFSVYQKPNAPLNQTAKITLTLKDTTVHTFTVPCKNIGTGDLVNKNSINIDDYLFTIGKPETFYCSHNNLDINNTIITIKNQESIPNYIDMKTNGNSVTVTFTRIPQPTEITRISLSAEDKVGKSWIGFDYIINASNFISGDVPRIVPVIDNEIGATNRSILLTEPTEFTVLMPNNKKVSNIELKAIGNSNRITIKNISYNKFLVSPNIDSPDSITLYAEITYEDGSGDYCEAYLETKNQTLLNDTLPNRKRLSFAEEYSDGSFHAVSQLDNWFPKTLYLAYAKDEYNYDIMPCDDANIKSIEALSSNEAVLKATVEKEKNGLGYVIKYTIGHNVPFDTTIVLTAKITYNNGDIRKAYAMMNPQSSNGWIVPTVNVPTQRELELSGTTLQQYLNKADVKPFSNIQLKEDTYIGDLVLNRPLNITGVSQTQSVIKGSILYKWQTDLRSFSIQGSNRKGVGIASSYKSVGIMGVGISDFDIGIKLQNITGGSIYDLNVSNCHIGILSNSTTYNTYVGNCDIGIQGSCYSSTLENNKIAQQILPMTIINYAYYQCQKNKFINNEINIDNQMVKTTILAEQNYFNKTKNADGTFLKESINYPYAASIKGDVKVEPYFLDDKMTKLSIVLPPQDSSGTVDLKPTNTVTVKNEDGTTTEKNEATVTIDNPTGDAKINDAVFEAAGNASASTDETKKVDNLVFEVKSEKAETEIKWSFSAEELKKNYDKPEAEQIKAPSLSVKFDFDQLAPEQEDKLTAEEVLAKNSIKEIIKETQDLKPGTDSILYQSISFSHSGELPAPATITIKKNAALSRPGALDVLRIYWFNPAKGALEAMLDELDSDGDKNTTEYLPIKDNGDTISFVITHCSEYIVAAESSNEQAIIKPETTAVFDITAIKTTNPIDDLKISTDKEFVSNIKLESKVADVLNGLKPENVLTAKKDGKTLNKTDTISTGTRIVYEVGTNPNQTERAHITAVIYGDVNGDGCVTTLDLLNIRGRILSRKITVNPKNALDVAANIADSATNELNTADLLTIRAHLLKAKLIDQNL